MRIKALCQFMLALCLPLSAIAVDPPKGQVKPAPRPAIRPVPRPIPGARPLPGRFPGRQPAKPQPVQWGEKQIVVIATITDIKQRAYSPVFSSNL